MSLALLVPSEGASGSVGWLGRAMAGLAVTRGVALLGTEGVATVGVAEGVIVTVVSLVVVVGAIIGIVVMAGLYTYKLGTWSRA